MNKFSIVLLSLLFTACAAGTGTTNPPADASQSELNMAEMMGITVEELRKQTPEEHMKMMKNMMNMKDSNAVEPTANAEVKAVYDSLSPQAQGLYFKQSKKLTQPVAARIVELDEKTIGCFGPSQVLSMSTDDKNLGGQCCGALTDITAYRIQLETIEHFIVENGGRDIIPADPYDLTVEVSQQLTQIDKDITLSSEQQMTFDNAVAMSHHGGPCCCKCWKWFVMSGLAKNLIVEEKWNQNQIAELWDISSSCGHAEDTDMHAHYS
jgi:hypothetical protein